MKCRRDDGIDLAGGELKLVQMKTVDIQEAASQFASFTSLLERGETILICRENKPFAEVRPVTSPQGRAQRKFGLFQGQIKVPDDFNAADLEVESLFCNGRVFPKPPAPDHPE